MEIQYMSIVLYFNKNKNYFKIAILKTFGG